MGGSLVFFSADYAFGRSILGDDRTVFGKKVFGSGQKVKSGHNRAFDKVQQN